MGFQTQSRKGPGADTCPRGTFYQLQVTDCSPERFSVLIFQIGSYKALQMLSTWPNIRRAASHGESGMHDPLSDADYNTQWLLKPVKNHICHLLQVHAYSEKKGALLYGALCGICPSTERVPTRSRPSRTRHCTMRTMLLDITIQSAGYSYNI